MARHFTAASSDYVDCGTGPRGSDIGTVSVCAWVNLDDHTSEHTVVGRWGGSDASWLLSIDDTGHVLFAILDTSLSGHVLTGATVLTDGEWTHVGGAFDGSTMRVYLAGAVDASSSPGVSMHHGTMALLIGQHASSAYMNGSIAEVSVFSGFAAAQIPAMARGASPSEAEAFGGFHIGYWPLLGSSPEPDMTPNDNPGTVHGTTVVDHPPVHSITAFQS